MPREQDEQVGAHVCDERLNVEGKVRVAVLVGATVVAVFLALAPGGFAQGLESGADAEREKAFVEALRREDPEDAKRYVALRDARGSGRWISDPIPRDRAAGRNPMTATIADTTIARKRIARPRSMASRVGWPSSCACRIEETSTTPLSTLTPNTAMYPTAAEMLKVVDQR